MTISEDLKRRFVKDYALPINVFRDDMFDYMIELLDPYYSTKSKYELFVSTVYALGGQEGFFKYFFKLKDTIIHDVSTMPAYAKFNNADMNQFAVKNGYKSKNIYTPEFDCNVLISIDLKKANFNALRYFNPNIVHNTATYDEFMTHYDVLPYFSESKQLRQVIFGNLNPKRQQTVQSYIINKIAQAISNNTSSLLADDEISVVSSDEIILMRDVNIFHIAECIPDEFNDFTVIEPFVLRQIHPEKSWFSKQPVEHPKKVQFKQVPAIFLPQVIKHVTKRAVTDFDMTFIHEGCYARFTEPVY